MDEIAISYLGYLPQEMEGTDIFNFYHPGDLVYLKEAYENIIADQGKPFKSREYRFKAKNGCYLTLETIWSCFINPWSKKLEFVDAKHTIVKEPLNRDIFAEPGENVGVTDIALESGSNDNTTTLEEDRKQVCTLVNSGIFKNIIPKFFYQFLGKKFARKYQSIASRNHYPCSDFKSW